MTPWTTSPTPVSVDRGTGGVLLVAGVPDLTVPVLLRREVAGGVDAPVRLVLLLDDTDRIEWLLPQDVLVVGLTGCAGDGDVVVRPDGDALLIELGGGAPGTASLRLSREAVESFLAA